MSSLLRLSPIDEARFGIRSARADIQNTAELEATFQFCGREGVRFLVARVPTQELQVVQQLERAGFLLMDTLLYYMCDLPIEHTDDAMGLRLATPDDGERVAAIAAQAFSGYLGHYHADLRLNRADCDAVYVSWAERSCTVPGVADAVLLAEYESQVMGFVTVKRTTEADAEVPLYGVGSEWQRRGLGKALIAGACRWAHEQGATRMWISTQVTNIASQKIWSGLELRLDHSYYTFHKWFD